MLYTLQVIMRSLHFVSLAVLLGGAAYWRLVLMPSTAALPEGERVKLAERDAAAFRPFVLAAIAGLIVSGAFKILAFPGHNLTHNILLGVKLLLAAHVFASVLIATRSHSPRRSRALTSVAASGCAIIVIAAYLRVFY